MNFIDKLEIRIEELKIKLEIERMRLAGCGVIAMANTTETLNEAVKMHDDYKSASANDVERAVREEIRLREENAELKIKLDKAVGWTKEIRKYARHDKSCDLMMGHKECDCGFTTLLNRFKEIGVE